MKIVSIVGTRPNFMKIAPLIGEFKKRRIDHVLVHTGQHYDHEMSRLFFDELGIPKPDVNLEVGSGSYGDQIFSVLTKLKRLLARETPDMVVVVGDVNSTFAGALAAKQSGIRVAHVEAGLRSFDFSMLEEINRIFTDRISDLLFTTEKSGNENLEKEGIPAERVFFVGNVMIDTLLGHKDKSAKSKIMERLDLRKGDFCVLTLHRPSNVDSREGLENIISILEKIQEKTKIVFPVHPRTKKSIEKFKFNTRITGMQNLILTEPLGYLDFLCLMSNSTLILTDSGGIQEEATILGIPCITLRDNTERPVTAEQGTNMLVSTDSGRVVEASMSVIDGKAKKGKKAPELWDGKAAQRIADIIAEKTRKGSK